MRKLDIDDILNQDYFRDRFRVGRNCYPGRQRAVRRKDGTRLAVCASLRRGIITLEGRIDMKRTLLIIAIILAVGIPATITANRYRAAVNHKATEKTTDACCPADQPTGKADAMKEGASCPYVEGKSGDAAANPHMPGAKTAPTDEGQKCPVMSPAATKPVTKATVKPPVEKKVQSAVCPVMKTRIPDITKAAGHSVYKGKTYYFCCAGCKPLFDKDPSKYVGQ